MDDTEQGWQRADGNESESENESALVSEKETCSSCGRECAISCEQGSESESGTWMSLACVQESASENEIGFVDCALEIVIWIVT